MRLKVLAIRHRRIAVAALASPASADCTCRGPRRHCPSWADDLPQDACRPSPRPLRDGAEQFVLDVPGRMPCPQASRQSERDLAAASRRRSRNQSGYSLMPAAADSAALATERRGCGGLRLRRRRYAAIHVSAIAIASRRCSSLAVENACSWRAWISGSPGLESRAIDSHISPRPAGGPRRCPRRACGRTRPARRHGPCAPRA